MVAPYTEASCAQDITCYPSMVTVDGVRARIETHGDITIRTLFDDLLYVWLVGPELIAAHITHVKHAASKGQHAREFHAAFNVTLRGSYELHVRVDQIGQSLLGYHREVFASPFHIFARGSAEHIDLVGRPVCSSVRAASRGSWFHQHHVHSSNGGFKAIAEQARNDYIWVPDGCQLRPVWDTPERLRKWYAQRVCAFGDSYLRTLLAGMLYYVGLTNASQYQSTGPAGGLQARSNWDAANTSFFWHTSSISGWETCSQEADVILMSLVTVPSRLTLQRILGTRSTGKTPVVYMLPHPWSGKYLTTKRNNVQLHRDRARTLAMLPRHVDVLDAWSMTHARHDEACDGTHFVCMAMGGKREISPVGLWEGVVLAQARRPHEPRLLTPSG